ncbi:MAG: anaerobic ribonucleoside-triphosphate reductase [Candidatus Woesearchaeota archaeon]|nr:anaerobic ribonucleoside-triphosphate reductase [Candidatus Woesearchaeota archaeon]
MHLGISLDQDFERTFMDIKHKHHELVKLEGLANQNLDPTRFFKEFLRSNNTANASIDDNSNVSSQNMNTLLNESNKPLMKLLSYNKIYIEMKEEFGIEIADQYLKNKIYGDIYENDSTLTSYMSYCFAYSIKDVAEQGLFFIGEMKAEKPKHLNTFNSHIIEFVAWATNQQAGAVGLPDFLLYQMKFWLNDINTGYISKEKAEKEKEQSFQHIIFSLNQPFLKHGIQSAYTNFTIMDREYFVGLFGGLEFDDGTFAIDYIEDFMQYQKDFLDFLNMARDKKSFTFPVMTASMIFKDGKYQDEDMAKYVVKHNMKYGDCNIYVAEDAGILSACCRMNFDTEAIKNKPEELTGNFNSIGGTDLNIGSSKVVTLNLPRIAYLAKGDFNKVKELVKEKVELIQKFHKAHRIILQKNIDRGLLPVYSYGLMRLEKQFATIGLNGIEEFVDILGGIETNKIGEKFYNDNGIDYVTDILDYINSLGEGTIEKYGFTQNSEVIPGESTGAKLLSKDRTLYKDFPIKDKNIYSNQWCGLDTNFPMEERIRVSGLLDGKTGGGQIFHANLGEEWTSFEDAWNFNNLLAKKGIIYWSEIRKWQYCKDDHNFFGENCPYCGGEALGSIMKIVGYLVKDQYYSQVRKEESKKRIFY